jgi:hypothetical protein
MSAVTLIFAPAVPLILDGVKKTVVDGIDNVTLIPEADGMNCAPNPTVTMPIENSIVSMIPKTVLPSMPPISIQA